MKPRQFRPSLHFLCLFLLTILIASTAPRAKGGGRHWENGMLLEVSSESFRTYSGATTTGRVDPWGNIRSHSTENSWRHTRVSYTIAIGDQVLTATQVLSWRWSKAVPLTVNAPVQVALDGDRLYVIDDRGREQKLSIVRRAALPPVQRPAPAPAAEREAAPPQPARAPEPVTSAVVITSTPPGADIEIDGRFVGSTPSTLALPPGVHEVVVKRDGFAAWSRKFTVISAGSTNLHAELEAKP